MAADDFPMVAGGRSDFMNGFSGCQEKTGSQQHLVVIGQTCTCLPITNIGSSQSQSSSIVCSPSKEHISIIHVPTLQHMFLWMTVFVYIWTGWGHRNLMSNVILRKSRLDKTFKT